MDDTTTAAFKQKTKLKGNKKEEKDKNLKGKVGKGRGRYSNCINIVFMLVFWNDLSLEFQIFYCKLYILAIK
jgi:hypothetical protein